MPGHLVAAGQALAVIGAGWAILLPTLALVADTITDSAWLEARGGEFHILEEDTYGIVTDKVPDSKTYCGLCSRLRRWARVPAELRGGVELQGGGNARHRSQPGPLLLPPAGAPRRAVRDQ